MQFNCVKSQLLESLLTVQRAVSSKIVIPAMSGILIIADKDVSLFATDLELSIKTVLNADIQTPGKVILPAKYLTEIVRNIQSEDISITVSDEIANIKGGKANFKINTLHFDEFPDTAPEELETIGFIQSGLFKKAVSYVIRASAKDESRPVLSGVLLKMEEYNIELASTDSYRLAVYKDIIEQPQSSNIELIIPGKVMDEIIKIMGNVEIKIEIEANNSHVKFTIGNVQVVSRLIDGQYPPYQQLIPNEFNHSIEVNIADLIASIKRIASIAAQNPLKFNFDKNSLKITATNQGIGEAEDILDIQYDGETQEIAFNSNYLLDGLTVIEEDTATLNLNEPVKPVLLRSNKENFNYIIMPVRVS